MDSSDVGFGPAAIMTTKKDDVHYVVSYGDVQLHGAEGRRDGLVRILEDKIKAVSVKNPSPGDAVGTQIS